MSNRNKNLKNNIVYVNNSIEVYYNNKLVCILDEEFDYLLDRTKYNLIRSNSTTEYTNIVPIGEKQLYVHRIVAGTKYELESGKDKHVNHINGNKIDNRLINLEYVSASENFNAKRCSLNDKQKEYMREYKRKTMGYTGDKNNRSRVIQLDLNLNVINTFDSVAETARELNIPENSVRKCVKNTMSKKKTGRNDQYKTFIFKYEK